MYETSQDTTTILSQMLHDLPFAQKYIPFLRPEYFHDKTQRLVFTHLAEYIDTYKVRPSKEELIIDMSNRAGPDYEEDAVELLNVMSDAIPLKGQYIMDLTETFITDRFTHEAILGAITASEGRSGPDEKRATINTFATLLLNPPSFAPDLSSLGLDTASPDFLKQLQELNMNKEAVIPFDIPSLNRKIQGVRRKTLNIVLAGTSCGKSLFLCHLTAAYARQGLNILYLTMEMDEQMTANRIYANLLKRPLTSDGDLVFDPDNVSLPKGLGRIVIKEFATGAAHTGSFRTHLGKLQAQAGFTPDIIVIDYLAICSSERLKSSSNNPNHIVVGSIAKELRALAQQTNAVVWTASQMNRAGMGKKADGKNIHGNLTNTAESIEVAFTADLIMSLSNHDEPNAYHYVIDKRRNGSGAGEGGELGVDRSRMRLYDISEADKITYDAGVNDIKAAKATKKLKEAPVKPDLIMFEIDRMAA